MSSSKPPILRVFPKGMHSSASGESIPEGYWKEVCGMRFWQGKVVQFPRKRVWKRVLELSAGSSIQYHYPWRVNGFAFLPVEAALGGGVLVVLTEGDVLRMEYDGSFSRISGGPIIKEMWSPNFGGHSERWGMCVYGGKLYFTRPGAPVGVTDGWHASIVNPDVHGRYVEVFYDHLVVANGYRGGFGGPYHLFWSDLRNFGKFQSGLESEADYYKVHEHQRIWCPYRGITGMARLGELLLVYTPEAIFGFQYVGLPKVFQESHVVLDHGCGFPHGLVALNDMHLFPSFTERTFFLFRGGQIENIGQPVAEFFFNSLRNIEDVWSFYDPRYREVWWVYGIKGYDNGYQMAVVFNIDERTWTSTPVEDISAFVCSGRILEPIDSEVPIDSDMRAFDEPDGGIPLPEVLYGRGFGEILREEEPTDQTSDLIYVPPPYLVSPYYTHGSGQIVKETDSLTIHANYAEAIGILVSLSAKKNLAVPEPYVPVGHVTEQYWTTQTPEARFSFPRAAGRALSYKFNFIGGPPQNNFTSANKFVFGVELPGYVEQPNPGGSGTEPPPEPPEPPGEPPVPTPCEDNSLVYMTANMEEEPMETVLGPERWEAFPKTVIHWDGSHHRGDTESKWVVVAINGMLPEKDAALSIVYYPVEYVNGGWRPVDEPNDSPSFHERTMRVITGANWFQGWFEHAFRVEDFSGSMGIWVTLRFKTLCGEPRAMQYFFVHPTKEEIHTIDMIFPWVIPIAFHPDYIDPGNCHPLFYALGRTIAAVNSLNLPLHIRLADNSTDYFNKIKRLLMGDVPSEWEDVFVARNIGDLWRDAAMHILDENRELVQYQLQRTLFGKQDENWNRAWPLYVEFPTDFETSIFYVEPWGEVEQELLEQYPFDNFYLFIEWYNSCYLPTEGNPSHVSFASFPLELAVQDIAAPYYPFLISNEDALAYFNNMYDTYPEIRDPASYELFGEHYIKIPQRGGLGMYSLVDDYIYSQGGTGGNIKPWINKLPLTGSGDYLALKIRVHYIYKETQ